MDLSLPIRIVRDVVNRTGLHNPPKLFVEKKPDGTRVTDVDPLVEHIVLEHLRPYLPADTAIIGEETQSGSLPAIRELHNASCLVTVDGIDGTGHFVDHCNSERQVNDKWLAAMTAIYQRNLATGLFDPVLSFAYQPHLKRLFCLAEGRTVCVINPLSDPSVVPLLVEHEGIDRPRGSVDVYLDKATCPHIIDPAFVSQRGPSGFNFVSLIASGSRDTTMNPPINFTSFHYTLWDFGLWPIANAMGFVTADFEDIGKQFRSLDVDWFGEMDQPPGKIRRPLLIAHPAILESLAGAIRRRG